MWILVLALIALQFSFNAGSSEAAGVTPARNAFQVRDTQCSCRAILNDAVSKLEANYIGYHLTVRRRREVAYQRYLAGLRARADRTTRDECIFVLQDYVKYFRDGHLFIGNAPKLTEGEIKLLSQKAETITRTEPDLRRYFDSQRPHLDPIEGIWYSTDGYRVGIFRDRRADRREFVAIMLSENVEGWTPGQIKAQFKKLPDGSYDVVLYARNHSPRYPNVYLRGQQGGAAIRRGLLLHMPPNTWGKEYPIARAEKGLIDPVNPRLPVMRAINDSTVVVHIPSHSPEHAAILKTLVEQYRERILSAENLIIDIRGDEGGSAGTTDVLMPFMTTKDKRPGRDTTDSESFVVSSPDNISYFTRLLPQGWLPPHLVDRLTANPGKVIPLNDPDDKTSQTQSAIADEELSRPRHVAILVDRAVVSAGEAFLLKAMKNKKVTLFGQNSGGVIDYQNVAIIFLPGCSQLGLYVGYPTMAASNRLPAGGINATGIAPHVRIDRRVKDPIDFIVKYYASHHRRSSF